MTKKKITLISLASLVILIFIPFSYFSFLTFGNFSFYKYINPGYVIISSLSSSGQYALTSHSNTTLILWDIKNRKKYFLSHSANIYSPYFIKNSNKFIWQDLNNIVHVENIQEKEIISFKNFPVYGQVMSDNLKTYFSCNENLDLYSGYNMHQHLVLGNGNQGGFSGAQKLINLTLSSDSKYLLSSGMGGFSQTISDDDGLALWYTRTNLLIKKIPGNLSNIFATFSPDNNYIVSGDQNSQIYIWNNHNRKLIRKIFNDNFGELHTYKINGNFILKEDFSGYPSIPESIKQNVDEAPQDIYSIKFIDNEDYLRFNADLPYATLYTLKKPKPLQYLYLQEDPAPSVGYGGDYSRDESIDTAPSAHILVTGQANENGINVYQFDPKTLSLHRIWAGKA